MNEPQLLVLLPSTLRMKLMDPTYPSVRLEGHTLNFSLTIVKACLLRVKVCHALAKIAKTSNIGLHGRRGLCSECKCTRSVFRLRDADRTHTWATTLAHEPYRSALHTLAGGWITHARHAGLLWPHRHAGMRACGHAGCGHTGTRARGHASMRAYGHADGRGMHPGTGIGCGTTL